MSAINRRTRLSPPLMHVFRSAHEAKDAKKKSEAPTRSGDQVVAGRRSRARQVITESALRREVARDLDALLNTVAMESTIDMTDAEHVRRSILNFGLPDIANRTIDEVRVRKVPDEIRAAILSFEPRLAAASLQVERDMSVVTDDLRVRFIVRADLVCDPVHVPVEFIADVTETGKIVVNRL